MPQDHETSDQTPAGEPGRKPGRPSRRIRLILLFFLPLVASIGLLTWLVSATEEAWEYAKLGTPRYPSLILGTSRAAWAIRPDTFPPRMLNFAFSMWSSPYGEVYHRAIMAKTGRHTGGLYVLEVSPLGLCFLADESENALREQDEVLGRVHQYWGKPNPEFILRYKLPQTLKRARRDTVGIWLFDTLLKPIPTRKDNTVLTIFDDGWMTLKPARPETKDEFIQRSNGHFDYDKLLLETSRASEYRLRWLGQTARDLSAKGKVYLVRLPTSARMREMENEYWPDFDARIQAIADTMEVPYLNFIHLSGEDMTVDFCHLNDAEIEKFNQLLKERIDAETETAQSRFATSSSMTSVAPPPML